MRSLALLLVVGLSLPSCRPAGDRADSSEALSEAGAPGAAPRRNGDPVAKGAENVVLPAVENITDAPPTALPEPSIPAQYRGRWGLVAADCTSTRGDAKGLITISDRTIRFYESNGTLRQVRPAIATSFSGDFSFTGEGMSWQRAITLTRTGDTLRRVEPAADGQPAVDLTYTICPR